jgi:hypothetical protein
MSSPIGALMIEAGTKSAKKPNGHTAVAPCGCEVHVSRFGQSSQRIAPSPCVTHREKSESVEPTKRRRRGSVEVEA